LRESPDLEKATRDLVHALDEGAFEYAIIGGLAVILNGYDRNTLDVDAVVWELDDRLEDLASRLIAHGFTFRVPDGVRNARQIRLLRMQDSEGVHIDLSMGFFPFEHDVIARASPMKLSESVTAQIASVEDLVIMKLVASRDRDLDDITRLLELYPNVNRPRIRRIVSDFAEALERPEIVQNLRERLRIKKN